MVYEFFQNFWKSFGVLFSKTREKLVLKEKSRACLPNTPLSKNRGIKNTLKPCLANTALIIKKTFFFFGEIGHAKHFLMSRKGVS